MKDNVNSADNAVFDFQYCPDEKHPTQDVICRERGRGGAAKIQKLSKRSE